jgi:CRISPR-associated Csx3 family protein
VTDEGSADTDSAAANGRVVIDVEALYRARGGTAVRAELPHYEAVARRQAGEGNDVVLTGRGPIWLYLRISHALHGTVRSLTYRAPEAGDVLIFDHTSR